ncbi:MAG: glycosyl transferase, group 1 [Acidobacteria bacterium]|nr:glycosyl transferase, group 1 [Acidobacteriota bacterium]
MRIALVLCVFPPEREPAGVMASQLARALSAEHEVRVICPQPNRPDGVLYPGFERRWHERSQDGPFQVDRVWSWFASTKGPLLGRALEAISFGLTAAWQVLAGPRADVVLLETCSPAPGPTWSSSRRGRWAARSPWPPPRGCGASRS